MKKFWNWKSRTVTNEETQEQIQERTLSLNGTIAEESWFDDDVTPQLFKDELMSGSGNITVWINSPGGDCVAAAQIYNMLMDYHGDVTVKIDGIAASAASVVAMAGEETLISPTGMLMCHNPMTCAMGNKADMEKAIALLDEVKESIINAYAEKSHLSRNKIARLMDEETWMNAEKALQLGFVDGILFSKKNPFVPEEPEKTDPDEEETEESSEEDPDEKKKESTASMLYTPSKTLDSFLQKISATASKGTPINQLDKRLELLKY